jgi:hypothetical protein
MSLPQETRGDDKEISYFCNEVPEWIEIDLLRASQWFQYHNMSKSQVKELYQGILQKAETAIDTDGVNGSKWERILTEQEREFLILRMHFHVLTNSGIKEFAKTSLEYLLE